MRYTEFKVNSDIILRLRLTLESMVLFERNTGESPLVVFSRIGTSHSTWSRTDCINILHYSIIEDHKYDDIYDILDEFLVYNTDEDLILLLIQLVKDSGFLGSKTKIENNVQSEKLNDNINKIETFEESLTDFLKGCLKLGITEDVFWTSTYGELSRMIEALQEAKLDEQRSQATFDYMLANLVGISVGRLMSKDVNMPSIEEVYPGLFDGEDIKKSRAEAEAKQHSAKMRARLMEYMTWNNAKMANKKVKEETKKANTD